MSDNALKVIQTALELGPQAFDRVGAMFQRWNDGYDNHNTSFVDWIDNFSKVNALIKRVDEMETLLEKQNAKMPTHTSPTSSTPTSPDAMAPVPEATTPTQKSGTLGQKILETPVHEESATTPTQEKAASGDDDTQESETTGVGPLTPKSYNDFIVFRKHVLTYIRKYKNATGVCVASYEQFKDFLKSDLALEHGITEAKVMSFEVIEYSGKLRTLSRKYKDGFGYNVLWEVTPVVETNSKQTDNESDDPRLKYLLNGKQWEPKTRKGKKRKSPSV